MGILAFPKNNDDYVIAGKELIDVCEETIAKCPIKQYQYTAIFHICNTASITNNKERAIELAKSMPRKDQSKEELLKRIDGDFS